MRFIRDQWTCALVAVALSAGACADVGHERARRDWLQNTLVEDNLQYFERDPELSALKMRKMASGVFPYFRGSARQQMRDAESGPVDATTAYGSASSSLVAIMGDPHPENIGTYRNENGDILVEYNDFDAATYGPYWHDVRRLALGFYVGGKQLEANAGITQVTWEAAAAAAVRGYVEEIDRLRDGEDPFMATPTDGEVMNRVIDKAIEKGDEQSKLNDYTEVVDGQRVMKFGVVDPPVDGVVDDELREIVVDEEEQLIYTVLESYRSTVVDQALVTDEAMAVKGIGRRIGAGVASYPVLRYYALVEGPTADPADDILLELKELGDPLILPGLQRFPQVQFADNGERAVLLQRWLQGQAQADPYLGWGSAGPIVFRVRHRTGYQRGIDISDIEKEMLELDQDADDYVAYAEIAGRILARSHAATPTLDRQVALVVIAEALRGDPDGFRAETEAFVNAYGPVVIADHQRLVSLIDIHGPLLGYTP